MSDTPFEVGSKLVALCRQNKHMEAIKSIYEKDIVSIEPFGDAQMPARMEGIEAVIGKSEWWTENHQVHGGDVQGPFPHGDRFVVFFKYDITPKAGPMAGKRFEMSEAALYTVKDGKISQEEFFYHMG